MLANVKLDREEFLRRLPFHADTLVHLTRAGESGDALETLASILRSGKVEARSAHGRFNKRLEHLPEEYREKFKVACFTETPAEYVNAIAAPVKGRSFQVEPYGVMIEKKDAVLLAGGERVCGPVWYVTWPVTEAVDRFWEAAIETRQWWSLCQSMPLVSNLTDNYDFHWEREWRANFDVSLDPDNTTIICPEAEWDRLFDLDLGRRRARWQNARRVAPEWDAELIRVRSREHKVDANTWSRAAHSS